MIALIFIDFYVVGLSRNKLTLQRLPDNNGMLISK